MENLTHFLATVHDLRWILAAACVCLAVFVVFDRPMTEQERV